MASNSEITIVYIRVWRQPTTQYMTTRIHQKMLLFLEMNKWQARPVTVWQSLSSHYKSFCDGSIKQNLLTYMALQNPPIWLHVQTIYKYEKGLSQFWNRLPWFHSPTKVSTRQMHQPVTWQNGWQQDRNLCLSETTRTFNFP